MALFSRDELGELLELEDRADQLDWLAGRATGRDIFILSCGPSLSEYSPEGLNDLLRGHCVFAVKQAFPLVPDLTDIQILNTWNSQKYDYAIKRPFVVRETAAGDPPVFGESDLDLTVSKPSNLSEQLARKQNFDDFTFARTLQRPWGPGVLYEIGFYLAMHMGCRRIITLGWDVGVKNSAVMPHFYDRPDSARTRVLAEAARMQTATERNRYLHDNGVLYNKPRIVPDEVDGCIRASEGWRVYLESRGTEIIVVSQNSLVSDKIRRDRLENLVSDHAA